MMHGKLWVLEMLEEALDIPSSTSTPTKSRLNWHTALKDVREDELPLPKEERLSGRPMQ